MDSTGGQLHPNWRALATVHIPVKRFLKEGTQQTQQGTHISNSKKYEIQGVDGQEIKEFYEKLLKKEKTIKLPIDRVPTIEKQEVFRQKKPFDVNKFHRFCMENQVDKLKEMDFHEADINVRDCYGWTALMMAACEGSLAAVMFLLKMGADRNAKDKTGRTAMELARKRGHFHIEHLMEMKTDLKSTEAIATEEIDLVPFYCEICQRTFKETTRKQHQTSTVHQFNMKSSPSKNKLQKFNIPPRNRGLQIMVKQGWDKESGLGPSNTGRLYPVKTVIRKERTGLGIDQAPARVTHFQPYDKAAVHRNKFDDYRNKARNRNDIRREKIVEWKRDRRLRNELN